MLDAIAQAQHRVRVIPKRHNQTAHSYVKYLTATDSEAMHVHAQAATTVRTPGERRKGTHARWQHDDA
jgi:hypothetical protein